MKIIVTGAAGFIGSHIAEKLVKIGHSVTGIDCFTNYYSRDLKETNLEHLRSYPNFSFIEGNLLSLELNKIFESADALFHEAAQPGVRKSWGYDFADYIKNNIEATQVLLEAASKTSLKHIVYASSSSIYGDAETFPTKEDALPKPVSPYGVTKLACEHLCNAYSKNFNLPIVMLRYFTVYGPRQRPDMAFNKFIRAALRGEKLVIYGNGLQTRDFTFVDDVVQANLQVLNNDIQSGIFNIGGGSTISVNGVIEIIEKIIGKKVYVDYLKPEKGDVTHTCADITKAKQLLNYKPTTTIQKGLELEVKWLEGFKIN